MSALAPKLVTVLRNAHDYSLLRCKSYKIAYLFVGSPLYKRVFVSKNSEGLNLLSSSVVS